MLPNSHPLVCRKRIFSAHTRGRWGSLTCHSPAENLHFGTPGDFSWISGGGWKTLASSTNFQYAITQDCQWLFYHGTDSAGIDGLYRVPLAGGQPEHLGAFPTNAGKGTMEISPDGRRIVTASYDYGHGFELWALDNFVPAIRKR